MAHWSLDDIGWREFDAGRVLADHLELVRAVAMVERNGVRYAEQMERIFVGDPGFQAAAREWAAEEAQHGRAFATWASLADPGFDYDASYRRFTEGFVVPMVDESIRGSRAGDLMARAIVEVGTSSFYAGLRDATSEPVLKQICHLVSVDEVHHYNLFLSGMLQYAGVDRFRLRDRARVALGRILEVTDDELAYAYYAGNGCAGPYDRDRHSRAFLRRAYSVYDHRHVSHVVRMTFRAVGLGPGGVVQDALARLGFHVIRRRARRLAEAGW